ncbi:MAG: M56 family metallopeptidase [Planctomycetota bacterium]
MALKNRSAHVRYLLWLIVVAKCLVPPLLAIPLPILPQEKPVLALETMDTTEAESLASSSAPVTTPAALTVAERPTRLTSRQWLGFGWVVGVAAFAVFAVIKALRTDFWLWRQRKLLPAELQTGIENLFSGLGIKTLPSVWLVEGIGQPFVWGLFRGSIYLPADFVKVNSAEHHRGVLGHELSHILRFDAAVNMLQITAQAIFWFHPFVWWANRKIRAEREKCCDEMAIASLDAKVKDYSTAIVNTLIVEHESTRPVPSLAVAGPVRNIEERIKTIMTPGKKFYKRPSWMAITVSLVVAVLAVPTTVALTKRTKDKKNVKADSTKVSVAGQVVSEETGKALIGVLVRVAVPATDMRMVRGSTYHTIYETRTDQQGRFQFEVPLDENTADISLDAFLSGYRSAAGTFRGGGDFRLAKVPVQPNKQIDFLIRLPSALYIAGVVKDHNGRPFAGVQVEGIMRFDRGSGGIARTVTDQKGRFEIFDYPVPAKKRKDERGRLVFRAETAKTVTIEDIYKMTPKQMRSLNVQMPRGWVITGVLLDVDGKPVANTNVGATLGPGIIIRECVTDENGRFKLSGLKKGPIILVAHAMDIKQKVEMPLMYIGKDREITLQLKSVKPKVPIKRVTLLGMQVADVTPEIKKIYDLPPAFDGVVILEPGKDHGRLGIGELREGYLFRIVGNKEIHNLREMIAEILRINDKPHPTRGGAIREGHRGRIRVVYVRRGSTNTQYLRLTDWDAVKLASLIKELDRSTDETNAVFQKSKQGSDIADRVISASTLSRLGKALLIYANDHEDRYPDTISQVEPYLRNQQNFEWIVQNVAYRGKAMTITIPPDTPIAYDMVLLAKGKGTNVLENSGRVRFVKPEDLEKLGVKVGSVEQMQKKDEIQVEARFLLLPSDTNEVEDFLKDERLQPSQSEGGLNSWVCFLNDEQVEQILEFARSNPGSKLLVAPRAKVLDGESATINTQKETKFASGYTEANDPSGEPEPKHDSVKTGVYLKVKPQIQPDEKNVLIIVDFNYVLTYITGYNKYLYKGKYQYQIPGTKRITVSSRYAANSGQTVALGGMKVTKQNGDMTKYRDLLVLIKAEKVTSGNPQIK